MPADRQPQRKARRRRRRPAALRGQGPLGRPTPRQQGGFFRRPELCDWLKRSLFRRLLDDGSRVPIRLWVAGCGDGEVAYAVAIGLLEVLGDREIGRPIRIFATDDDAAALGRARRALY